jgi:hypothetical protein
MFLVSKNAGWRFQCKTTWHTEGATVHNKKIYIQWSLSLRSASHRVPLFLLAINFRLTICWWKHGPQFRPIGALLGGLSRPQPISDPFYERLELSWLAFQCLMCVAFNMYFLYSINDNFSFRWFSWNQLLSWTEGKLYMRWPYISFI